MHRQKEDFTSVGGSSINLGTYKGREFAPNSYKADLLKHAAFTYHDQVNVDVGSTGLGATKFGKGFSRRTKEAIDASNRDESQLQAAEAYQQMRESRSKIQNEMRLRHKLESENKAGYNIISGQPLPGFSTSVSRPGVKLVGSNGLGPEAANRGKAILRESTGRYHAPFPSGHNQEYRQAVLYKEGLITDKYIGLLEVGKKDLPSYGIEDQFSKSEYTNNSQITRTGLYETRLPGVYTPRKIAGHPSANQQIVNKWNTNIDLNNRTLEEAKNSGM